MRLNLEIQLTVLLIASSLVGAYLPFDIAIVWVVGIILGMLWFVRKYRKSFVVAQRKSIEFETVEKIVERLPTSLTIGAHTHQEVFQRVIHLWEDSDNKGIILENILEGVCLLSHEGTVEYYNKRLTDIFGEVGPNVQDWKMEKIPR